MAQIYTSGLPKRLPGNFGFAVSSMIYISICQPDLFDTATGIPKQLIKNIKSFYFGLMSEDPTLNETIFARYLCVPNDAAKDTFSILKKFLIVSGLSTILEPAMVHENTTLNCHHLPHLTNDGLMYLPNLASANEGINQFLHEVCDVRCAACNFPMRRMKEAPNTSITLMEIKSSFLFLSFAMEFQGQADLGPVDIGNYINRQEGAQYSVVACIFFRRDGSSRCRVLDTNSLWSRSWIEFSNNSVSTTDEQAIINYSDVCIAVFKRRR